MNALSFFGVDQRLKNLAGDFVQSGMVDDAGVRLTLRPREDDLEAFAGTFTGSKQGNALNIQWRASSGDTKWVRGGHATLTLSEKP